MPTGSGDLQRAAGVRLPAHIGHVGQGTGPERLHRQFGGRCFLAAVERRAHLKQRACGEGFDVLGNRRFGTVGKRHDQPSPCLRGRQRRGQHAIDAAQLAGKRKLAEEFVIAQGLAVDLPAGSQDAEGDRQIEPSAFLRQIGRRQIDGNAPCGEFELRAKQRGTYAFARFAHCRFGQAHHLGGGETAGEMHFHPNFGRVHPHACTAVHQRQTHGGWPSLRER